MIVNPIISFNLNNSCTWVFTYFQEHFTHIWLMLVSNQIPQAVVIFPIQLHTPKETIQRFLLEVFWSISCIENPWIPWRKHSVDQTREGGIVSAHFLMPTKSAPSLKLCSSFRSPGTPISLATQKIIFRSPKQKERKDKKSLFHAHFLVLSWRVLSGFPLTTLTRQMRQEYSPCWESHCDLQWYSMLPQTPDSCPFT